MAGAILLRRPLLPGSRQAYNPHREGSSADRSDGGAREASAVFARGRPTDLQLFSPLRLLAAPPATPRVALVHSRQPTESLVSLIVSSRDLLARGAVSYLAEHRPGGAVQSIVDPGVSPLALPAGQVRLALVDVQLAGPDRLEGCDRFPRLRADPRLAPAVMVAVLDEVPGSAVQLRLVEAGASRWVRCEDLMRQPQRLAALADDPNDPVAACGLAGRSELRRHLGLHRDGNLNALVAELRHLPAAIWAEGQSQDSLPVGRRALINARKLAQSVGGVPPPDPAGYATLFRRAPLHPEWSTVRRLMREIMGTNAEPSTDLPESLLG